jgi:hypothetical protein
MRELFAQHFLARAIEPLVEQGGVYLAEVDGVLGIAAGVEVLQVGIGAVRTGLDGRDLLSKEDCARRAVTLLQQAVAHGYKDAEHMKHDDDLKALRSRDDFKKLLADLEAERPK